jgi:hypothetical protein
LTASCQRICSTSCARRSSAFVTGDQCKYMGEEAADTVAEAACKFVQVRQAQLRSWALHACRCLQKFEGRGVGRRCSSSYRPCCSRVPYSEARTHLKAQQNRQHSVR